MNLNSLLIKSKHALSNLPNLQTFILHNVQNKCICLESEQRFGLFIQCAFLTRTQARNNRTALWRRTPSCHNLRAELAHNILTKNFVFLFSFVARFESSDMYSRPNVQLLHSLHYEKMWTLSPYHTLHYYKNLKRRLHTYLYYVLR